MCTKPEQKILPKNSDFSGTWRLIQSPRCRRSACSQRSSHTRPRTYWLWRRPWGLVCQVPPYPNTARWSCWRTSQWLPPHFSFLVVMRSSCWPSALSTLQRIENCSLYIFHLSCWRNGSLRTTFTQQPKSRFASPGSSWSSWYQGHLRPPDLHPRQSAGARPTTPTVILKTPFTCVTCWVRAQKQLNCLSSSRQETAEASSF